MASSGDTQPKRPRVLILGGGFAGVGAAQKLKKADAEVVLVDRHDYHTFQALLYQLATGLLEQTAVGHSLRDLLSRHENTAVASREHPAYGRARSRRRRVRREGRRPGLPEQTGDRRRGDPLAA
jgi:NADPH-dependent 2,4-dienoyl-CoA reductase/sulfur reductase-like enzyme